MEKSPSALSVDNSLLDSIHPLSNSNREKFPTPRAVCLYVLYQQTNNMQTRRRIAIYVHVSLFVRVLIRVLEINLMPKGRVSLATVFVQKIRTRRSKLVYPTHPTSPPPPYLSLSLLRPFYRFTLPLSLSIPRTIPCNSNLVLSRTTHTVHPLRCVVLSYFSSRIRNVPCLWLFFRFFLYLARRYFSNSPNVTIGKRVAAGEAYVPH